VSWEQACRMGRGDEASRPRAAHVAHMISARVRCGPGACGDIVFSRDLCLSLSFALLSPTNTVTPDPFQTHLDATDGRLHGESTEREGI
jgi:hypothetical protein